MIVCIIKAIQPTLLCTICHPQTTHRVDHCTLAAMAFVSDHIALNYLRLVHISHRQIFVPAVRSCRRQSGCDLAFSELRLARHVKNIFARTVGIKSDYAEMKDNEKEHGHFYIIRGFYRTCFQKILGTASARGSLSENTLLFAGAVA